jgi:tight adherence protein C
MMAVPVFTSLFLTLGFLMVSSGFVSRSSVAIHSIGVRSGAISHSNSYYPKIVEVIQRFFSSYSVAPWGSDKQVKCALVHAGQLHDVRYFRRHQMLWLINGLLVFSVWILLRSLVGQAPEFSQVVWVYIAIFPASGWMALELLKNKATKRAKKIDYELPTVLDLIAFCVAAGEPIVLAMQRVALVCDSEISHMLMKANEELKNGMTLADVLCGMKSNSSSVAFFRAVHAIELAIDRGTPLADVLRAQAREARSGYRQQLLQLAGKKETLMMVPVVFLILPMIVFIALFPGLQALHLN